jgi:hypothetical protein
VGIFQAIGHAGVYYGFKLGHSIPWATGFPFNVVSHPQYVGSVATVLGAAVLVSRGGCLACPCTAGAASARSAPARQLRSKGFLRGFCLYSKM